MFSVSVGPGGIMMMGMGMGMNNFLGGPPSSGDMTYSECGPEFDAYTKEKEGELARNPFFFGMPEKRELDFWMGRRLRFYKSPTEFVEAKVVMWLQESNTRMSERFPYETEWTLKLEGDLDFTLSKPDGKYREVTLHKPKAHAGKTGTIVRFPSDGGDRYKIQMDDDPLKFVTLPRDSFTRKYNLHVHRMNVHGGGILRYCRCDTPTCQAKHYSIEWIDPPSPVLDLNRSVAKVTCPTCRAVEPTARAFDDRDCNTTSPKKSRHRKRPRLPCHHPWRTTL